MENKNKTEFLKRKFWYKFGNIASLALASVGAILNLHIWEQNLNLSGRTDLLPILREDYFLILKYFTPVCAFGLYGLFRYIWIRLMLSRYGTSLFSDIEPKWLKDNYGYDISKLEAIHLKQLRFCKFGAKTLLITVGSLIVTFNFLGGLIFMFHVITYLVVALWFFQFVIGYDERLYDSKCLTKANQKETKDDE